MRHGRQWMIAMLLAGMLAICMCNGLIFAEESAESAPNTPTVTNPDTPSSQEKSVPTPNIESSEKKADKPSVENEIAPKEAPASKSEPKPEVNPETKPEVKPVEEVKPEPAKKAKKAKKAKAEIKAAADTKTKADIRFQFDAVPYKDVLKRFSQMMNKPILGEIAVEGTLTFSDPRPYTNDEAMDTLNLILAMKGYALREEGRFLRLRPLAEVATTTKIFHGLGAATGIRSNEIVTVVLPVAHLDSTAASKAVIRLVSAFGSITPLDNNRGMVITDTMANIRRVAGMLKELDVEPPAKAKPQIKSVLLHNASAKTVAMILQKMFTSTPQMRYDSATRRMVPVTPSSSSSTKKSESKLMVAYDERINLIILFGAEDMVTQAEQVIATLDKDHREGQDDIRVFELKNATASAVAQAIHTMFPAPRAGMPSDVAVSADAANNRVIVTATKVKMDRVENLINKLDSAGKELSRTRIIRIENADAASLASPLVSATRKIDSRGRPLYPLVVTAEMGTNSIILTGPEVEIAKAEKIIATLDVAPTEQYPVKIIALTQADPVSVATILTQLYAPQAMSKSSKVPTKRKGGKVVTVSIRPELRSRSLLVRADKATFEAIAALAKKIDESASRGERKRTIIMMNYADATTVSLALRQAFAPARGKKINPEDEVTIVPEPGTNSLIVTASEANLKKVQDVVSGLDREDAARQQTAMMVLKNAKAADVSNVLADIFGGGTGSSRTSRKLSGNSVLAISADETSNAIVLRGSANDVDRAKDMITQLDSASSSGATAVYLLPLKSSEASAVLQRVQDLYNQQASQARAAKKKIDPMAVTADTRANVLILATSKTMYETVKTWVQQVEAMKPASRTMKIIPLKHSKPADVKTVVDQMFNEATSGTGSSVNIRYSSSRSSKPASSNRCEVTVLSDQSAVMVKASSDDLAEIEKIVQSLEESAKTNKRQTKIFALKNAPNQRVLQALRGMYPTARGATADQQVTISAVTGSNAILVAAPTSKMDEISHLIEQLDKKEVSSKLDFRIYVLENAQPTKVLPTLQKMIAQILRAYPGDTIDIQADQRTKSLIVTAREALFSDIEQLIGALDVAPAAAEAFVEVIMIEHGNASTLANVLNELLRPSTTKLVTPEALALQEQVRKLQVRCAADGTLAKLDLTKPIKVNAIPPAPQGCNALVIQSTKENLAALSAIAAAMDAPPAGTTPKVHEYKLENGNVTSIASTLQTLFAKRHAVIRLRDPKAAKAVIAPDVRTNTLMVSAVKEDLAIIESLLKKLDVELDDATVQLEVLSLKYNDAGTLTTSLKRLFAARRKSLTPLGQQQNPQDAVDIEADSLSNSLVVSASKENLSLLKGLLKKIDVLPTDEAGVVRMYVLEHADASRVAEMLKDLVKQGLYKPSLVGQGAAKLKDREKVSITVDTRTNVLIVSASRENFTILEQVLGRLDSNENIAQLNQIQTFPLKKADAVSIAPTIQQFFDKRLSALKTAGSTTRIQPVVVIADGRTNSLLVAGSRETFGEIKSMIERLDGDAVTPENSYEIFTLKHASASVLQGTLQKLFDSRNQRDGSKDKITVLSEPTANTLIVGCPPEDMLEVRKLITSLDKPTAGDTASNTKSYPLKHADAAELVKTLSDLYKTQNPTGTILIAADERTNTIVLTGGLGDIKRVGELVAQLDRETVANVTEIRVFPLKNANAEELATLLTELLTQKPKALTKLSANRQTLLQFVTADKNNQKIISQALHEGLLINSDKRTNSIVVSAPQSVIPLLSNLIGAMDAISPQEAEIRVFKLTNADATQMADVLNQLFRTEDAPTGTSRKAPEVTYTLKDGSGKAAASTGSASQSSLNITVDERTNCLLIGGTHRQIEMAAAVIADLDSSPAQQRVTKVYRPRNNEVENIEKALRSFLDEERKRIETALGKDRLGAAQRLLEREVAVVAEPNTNTLMISASPRYFDTLVKMIDELDQPPAQVLIQALLAEVNIDDTTDLGMEWSHKGTAGSNALATGADFNIQAGIQQGTAVPGFSVSVSGGNLNFFLQALRSQNRLEILSRPQLLAMDNQKGVINVGQEFPIITGSRISDNDQTYTTIQYKKIGVTLEILPRIGSDDTIRLEVLASSSSVGTSQVQVAEGVQARSINNRSAETTVTCYDGQTIIIGGLITTEEKSVENKIPVLGDLPYIGPLFRDIHKEKRRVELLIFLTPKIMRSKTAAKDITTNELKREHLVHTLNSDDRIKRGTLDGIQDKTLQQATGIGSTAAPAGRNAEIRQTVIDLGLVPQPWPGQKDLFPRSVEITPPAKSTSVPAPAQAEPASTTASSTSHQSHFAPRRLSVTPRAAANSRRRVPRLSEMEDSR